MAGSIETGVGVGDASRQAKLLLEAQQFLDALPPRQRLLAPGIGAIVARMGEVEPPLPASTAAMLLGVPGDVALEAVAKLRSGRN